MSFGKLTNIINEKVLAEWIDAETKTACTLGSYSPSNKQTTSFFLRAGTEPETGHIYIFVSLVVTVRRASTRTQKMEALLVFLPHMFAKNVECPITFESIKMPNLQSSSFLDPATIQQADLTSSGHIIRASFNLASSGCVVVPRSKSVIKPNTSTSYSLLINLKSLSNVHHFNLYMSRSDYAIQGLLTLNQHLRNINIGPSVVNLKGIFNGRSGMMIEWSKLQPNNERPPSRNKQLPPYSEASPPSPAEVQIPESPPIAREAQPPSYSGRCSTSAKKGDALQSPPMVMQDGILQQFEETVIVETPLRTSLYGSPIPPTPSHASSNCIADFEEEFPNIPEELENEIDSDEDRYDMLQARELSPPIEAPSVTRRLEPELSLWLNGAMSINTNIFNHQRLFSRLLHLGHYARTSNIIALDATRIWCSTILFYDPQDSGIPVLWSPANQWLISEIAELVKCSNRLGRAPEMCLPQIRCEFVKLGSTARAVALEPGCVTKVDNFRSQKAHCLCVLLLEFGSIGNVGSGRENRSRP